ncbi:MAG: TRAP transporter small permease [Atribacterota bacterium]|nr:TRAP transporter small permease [Atribacterota bacterium]
MLSKILKYILVFTFVLLIITVLLQVFSRYVLTVTIPWTEDGARLILIVMTFLGTAVALRDNEHIAITFLFKRIPTKYKNYVSIFFNLIILFFLIFFIKGSLEMTSMNWVLPVVSYPKLKIGYIYLILPISAFLMIYFLIIKILNDVNTIKNNILK